jgi:putative PEP-CTERM system TPR-repeat lipoprotein
MKLEMTLSGKSILAGASLLLMVACGENQQAMLSSAKDYLAKSDSKSAIIQIKNALQGNPSSSEARFLLGSALLESGDPVGAETELRKSLELKHPQDLVIPVLAKSLLAQGKMKKMIDEFAHTDLGEASARANFQTTLAAAYGVLGNADASQDFLKSALLAQPDYGPALLAQARKKAAMNDFDGAMAIADSVIGKNSQSVDAWKFKADILRYGKRQLAEALAAYRKTIEIQPQFLPGNIAVTTLLLQQGNIADADKQIEKINKFAANNTQVRFLGAQLAFQKKDFKSAREFIQQVLKSSPENVQALQLAGAIELKLDSLSLAEGYLSKALQGAPDLVLSRRLLVVAYLRSGQPAKALATLLPGLNREHPDPELLPVAGEVYLQNGDIKKAEEYFARVSSQDPKNAKNRTSLALTRLMGGQVDLAMNELQEISSLDTGMTADMALIAVFLRRQEFDRALQAVDGLEKKQPGRAFVANLRGRTLLAKQDFAGARKSFERAVEIDPGFFPALDSLAGLDLADKRPADAKKRFEVLLAKDPKNGDALLALAALASRSGAAKAEVATLFANAVNASPTSTAPRLLLIDFHLRNSDFKSALSTAQDALAALPESLELLDALGRTQQAAGEYHQAISTYEKLAGRQASSPHSFMRMADVHMANKNFEAAAMSLQKALAIKPDLVEAQRAAIALNVLRKDINSAVVIARTVQKQRPKEVLGYLLEGDIHASGKNWDGAALAYRSGLLVANAPDLAVRLHSVLLASGKSLQAANFGASWQKENPKDVAFLLYLGDDAIARKDYGGAEKIYTSVVTLQATNALAYNNLAWVTGKLKKEGAIPLAEKASALAPASPAFMDTLAMLLSDKGDYAKALELENKALTVQPQNSVFKLNLAKIHIKGGNRDLAKKSLGELRTLGDKFADQLEVEGLLKGL